ncbi:MAG TPA: MarR family transcriptional regulator [Solirubrobacteraceae bacterium]|nr:MarR family transcriptional regulator [Solirubrobacteraceae bacterium]
MPKSKAEPGPGPSPESAPAEERTRLSRGTLEGEPTLLYVMKQVELVVRAALDDIVRPDGLTALQYTALTVLERHPNLTSAQLARNSFVTAQAMADMVSALRDQGLIERHRDDRDRRRLVLALTPEGRKLLARYRDQIAALEDRMLVGLTDRQIAQLRESLLSCRAALSGHLPH